MVVDDVNMVKRYVYEKSREVKARGFDLGVYTRQKLAHLRTETVKSDSDVAIVRLTGEVREPMRSFFVGEEVSRPVDAELKMVREDGRWKVCGQPLALDEA